MLTWWFWSDFLPNLVATTIGVLLGLPVAMRVERWRTQRELDHRNLQEREQLNVLLGAIASDLERNAKALHTIADSTSHAWNLRELELSLWEGMRTELFARLPADQIELRIELSRHYGHVSQIVTALMDVMGKGPLAVANTEPGYEQFAPEWAVVFNGYWSSSLLNEVNAQTWASIEAPIAEQLCQRIERLRASGHGK